jgi:hypothetical protein
VVILLAGVVLAAEWSTAVKWDEPIVGVVFVLYQIPLVLALLAGVGLERSIGRRPAGLEGAEARSNRKVALAVGAVMLVLAALCLRFAVTEGSNREFHGLAPPSNIVSVRSCPGSPLTPVDYDCDPATGAVYKTGLAALLLGGWTMSALRLRRVRIPWAAVVPAVAVGVVLLGAAVAAVPGTYPSPASPGAPGGYGNAFQDWAFARVLGDLHTAGLLLALAVAILAPLAWSRWDRGVRLPVPAALVGVVNVAVAGLVVMVTIWVPLLAYFMRGP